MAKEKKMVLGGGFFEDMDIMMLEAEKNGEQIVLTLLKLYAFAAKSDGVIQLTADPLQNKAYLAVLSKLTYADAKALESYIPQLKEKGFVKEERGENGFVYTFPKAPWE